VPVPPGEHGGVWEGVALCVVVQPGHVRADH
jgi:hypothetical protein